jgi:hypothetical protein
LFDIETPNGSHLFFLDDAVCCDGSLLLKVKPSVRYDVNNVTVNRSITEFIITIVGFPEKEWKQNDITFFFVSLLKFCKDIICARSISVWSIEHVVGQRTPTRKGME